MGLSRVALHTRKIGKQLSHFTPSFSQERKRTSGPAQKLPQGDLHSAGLSTAWTVWILNSFNLDTARPCNRSSLKPQCMLSCRITK